jgi:hypothetical protein
MKVAIRRIELASLGKMGCLLGVVAAFLPSLVCGLSALGLANVVREWLEGWQAISISVLGQEIATFDLIHFANLDRVLGVLQSLGAMSVLALFLVVLGLALISGLLLALIITVVGLAYNLLASATGGVVVEMRTTEPKPSPQEGSPDRQS